MPPQLPRCGVAAPLCLLLGYAVGLPQLGAASAARVAAVLPVGHRPVVVAAERVAFAAPADRVALGCGSNTATAFVVVVVAAVFLTESAPAELIYTSRK